MSDDSTDAEAMSILTARFTDALTYATALHATQLRKGTRIPYLSHLLGVASLVLEDGGDEDEAIAALLHDAVEDQGGLPTLDAIRARYGERVAAIVLGCTDTMEQPKPPWRARKEAYIAHLAAVSPSVIRVSLADKLYNVRAIVRDVRVHGAAVWERFNGGRAGTVWYYAALADAYREREWSANAAELTRVVAEMSAIAETGG